MHCVYRKKRGNMKVKVNLLKDREALIERKKEMVHMYTVDFKNEYKLPPMYYIIEGKIEYIDYLLSCRKED